MLTCYLKLAETKMLCTEKKSFSYLTSEVNFHMYPLFKIYCATFLNIAAETC